MTQDMPEVAPLIADEDDRYDLIGLDIVHRETGAVDTHIPLTRSEIDMPGYVESTERGYATSNWRPVRVWRTTTRPTSPASTVRGLVTQAHAEGRRDGVADLATAMTGYLGLVEMIHETYRHIVMDTPEDRALHARMVVQTDQALRLVRAALAHGVAAESGDPDPGEPSH